MLFNGNRKFIAVAATACLLIASLIAIGFSTAARAADQEAPHSKAEAELLKAETDRINTMVRGGAAALAQMVGDELAFVHGNGTLQDKAAFLRTFDGNPQHLQSIEVSERKVSIYGNVGVTHGRQLVLGENKRFDDRFMGVYVRRNGRWLLVGWESTQIATRKPAPQTKK
jgi:hypothetical protein